MTAWWLEETVGTKEFSNRVQCGNPFEKIPALISIYAALQMSQELRESLLEALDNPEEYWNEIRLTSGHLKPSILVI